MYRAELQKLEGVWTGTESIETDSKERYEATGRWEFHTVFDGRFLLCDYIQNAPDRPTSIGHGVFRQDDRTGSLTVTWFRSPSATPTQQSDGVAEGDKLIFIEKIDKVTTRTTYSVALNRLTVITERAGGEDEWTTIFEGSYRRPRG
ncbi:MAG: DUF1579 family protein [Actinobacteria bacterium]|nr:DUF1579 family protein [Actinomycetota bacterium]